MKKLMSVSRSKRKGGNAFLHFKKIKLSQTFIKKLKEHRECTKLETRGSLNGIPDSDHHLKRMINQAMVAINIPSSPNLIGRKEIVLIAKEIGVSISRLQATEIILLARGPKLEKSRTCDLKEIIAWFRVNMKMLRPKNWGFNKTNHNRSYDASLEYRNVRTRSQNRKKEFLSQPRIHRKSNTSGSFLYSSSKINSIRKMRIRDLKKDQDFMDDVDECLINIKEVPTLRKQMNTIFNDLENTLVKTKAEESFSAADKTRKYLIQKKRNEEKKYKKDLDKMIIETSKTSANNAIRLSKLLTSQWFDHRKNFSVVSGLTTRQRDRLKI